MKLSAIFWGAVLLSSGIFTSGSILSAAEEKIFCDFESGNYGNWKIEGSAFGSEPAQGTMPHQMKVTGFMGKRLVNTYHPNDGAVGKLTSPEFKVEHNFISFLIGGGGHPGTHIDLLIDGKAVRTARGTNIKNGGTEDLEWNSWNVKEFKGKKAAIQIVDQETGGWGHLNIDQITFSDSSQLPVTKEREILIEKKYLWLPVQTNRRKTWVQVTENGRWYHEFEIKLADNEKDITFYANYDVTNFLGKKLKFKAEKVLENNNGLDLIRQFDQPADLNKSYQEKYRPQFHFSPRRGWTNDPNGLVYYKGTYHLFFQHNPYDVQWGNMTWGHAISHDLFHWQEQSDAILADQLGTIFSGSAVVDWKNTSGLQKGSDPPMICIYTQNGPNMRFGHKASQSVAYSLDGGKTFKKYEKNPVIPNIIGGNRDPKVFWYEPSKIWVMALYMDKEDYALFESKNLLQWKKICDITNLGCSECPDMFELAIDGNTKNKKWVFWGGNGKYLIGSFNGKTFKKESEPLNMKWGGNDYAAQSYSDTPGRRIQFSWMNGGQYPGMPFTQQFSIPRELSLRSTPEGIRLCTNPVKELENLHRDQQHWENLPLSEHDQKIQIGKAECLDLQLSICPNDTERISINLRGRTIDLDWKKGTMTVDGVIAPLNRLNQKKNGKTEPVIDLRIVLDRLSIEVFAQNGLSQITKCFFPLPDKNKNYNVIEFKTNGKNCRLNSMNLWSVDSVWPIYGYSINPLYETQPSLRSTSKSKK